jgi:hypothetical protein
MLIISTNVGSKCVWMTQHLPMVWQTLIATSQDVVQSAFDVVARTVRQAVPRLEPVQRYSEVVAVLHDLLHLAPGAYTRPLFSST